MPKTRKLTALELQLMLEHPTQFDGTRCPTCGTLLHRHADGKVMCPTCTAGL